MSFLLLDVGFGFGFAVQPRRVNSLWCGFSAMVLCLISGIFHRYLFDLFLSGPFLHDLQINLFKFKRLKKQIKAEPTTNDQKTRTNNKYTKEKSKPNRIKRKILVNEKKEKKSRTLYFARDRLTHTRS